MMQMDEVNFGSLKTGVVAWNDIPISLLEVVDDSACCLGLLVHDIRFLRCRCFLPNFIIPVLYNLYT